MWGLRRGAVWFALAAAMCCAGPAAARTLDYSYFLTQLVDLDGLPRMEPGVTCRMASSYDRRCHEPEHEQANGDAGQYLRVEPDGEAVMADLEGPGCIFRIWSANPQGKIRLYLDGDDTPTYEFDFDGIFRGDWGAQKVPRPIVYKRGAAHSASDAYLPIPYARSCRVTADKAHGQYYHVQYKTYPAGTQVQTFRLPLDAQQQALLEKVAAIWAARGENPQPPGPGAQTVEGDVTLEPGQPARLAMLPGPGVVKALRMKLVSEERYALRKTMLRILWDDERQPDVDAPLGDFFGAPWGEVPYRSLPLGVTEDGGYCYFRMPFHWRALFAAENQGETPAALHYEITWEPAGSLGRDVGLFHAKWRREEECARFNYPFLQAWGQGKYVGVMMGIEHPTPGWWGEGDEKVRVDGEDFPGIWGTGSEDFFGDAWGIRADLREPVFGCYLDAGARTICYRFQVSDSIPFETSFDMAIENYPPNDDDYFSVAYWYATRPGADFFPQYGGAEYTVAERMPWGRRLKGAMEFEEVFGASLPQAAAIVSDARLPVALSGGAGVDIGSRGENDLMGPAPFHVAQSGAYHVLVYGARGRTPPAMNVAIDGTDLRTGRVDAAKSVAAFGPVRLEAGGHTIALRFGAGASGVIDAFALEQACSEHAVEAELASVARAEGGSHAVQDMVYSGKRHGTGAQLFFMGREKGAVVGIEFEAPEDGAYTISAWMSTSHDYGVYQMAVDGELIGEPFDLWSPQWVVAAKSASAEVRLEAGTHRLDFVAVGRNEQSKGYYIGIDAFAAERMP